MDATELEQALAELEEKLEKLRVLYDQYFMGLERFEPIRKREDVERRIKTLRRENIRNTAQRFRFQQSVQRLNTFSQYWTRILREIEKGTYKRDLAKAARRFGDASLGKKNLTTADLERAAQAAAAASKEPEEIDSVWLEDEPEDDTSPLRLITAAPAAPGVSVAPKGPPGAPPLRPTAAPGAAPPPLHRAGAQTGVTARAATDDLTSATTAPATPAASVPAPRTTVPAAPAAASAPGLRRSAPPPRIDLDDDDDLFAGLDMSGSTTAPPPGAARASVTPAKASPGAAPTRPATPTVPVAPPRSPLASVPVSAGGVPAPRPAMSSVPAAPAPRPAMSSVPAAPAPRPAMSSVPAAPAPRPAMGSTPAVPAPRPAMGSTPAVPAPRPAMSSVPGSVPRPAMPSGPPSGPRAPMASVPQVASSAILPSSPIGPERGPRPARPEPRAAGEGLQDARIRDIYDRYVEARRRTNEPTGSLTLDGLSRSLRDSIPKLQQKHGGRVVDFEVVIKDGKTVLKPVVKSGTSG